MNSRSYVRKNTLLATKGGCICTPLTPPESATELYVQQWHVQNLTMSHRHVVDFHQYNFCDNNVVSLVYLLFPHELVDSLLLSG